MKIKKLLIKSVCLFAIFSLSSFLSGCIAFKSVKDKIDDPIHKEKVKDKDDEYWDKVKKNTEDAIIIINK